MESWAYRRPGRKYCRGLSLFVAFAFAALSGCNCHQPCTHSQCEGFVDLECCSDGKQCSGGQCVCPAPSTDCGAGYCSDLNGDSANCGRCGNVCSGETTCQGGQCKPCPSGLTFCEGVCVDLVTTTAAARARPVAAVSTVWMVSAVASRADSCVAFQPPTTACTPTPTTTIAARATATAEPIARTSRTSWMEGSASTA